MLWTGLITAAVMAATMPQQAQAHDLTGEVLSGNATRPELVLNGGPI